MTAATLRAATARRKTGGGKTRREVQAAGDLRRNSETAGPGETETGRRHRRTGGGRGGGVRRRRNPGDVRSTIVGSDTSLTVRRMSADPVRKTEGSERRFR